MATDKVVVDIITNSDKSNRDMLKFAAGVGVAAAAVAGLYAIGKDLVAAYAVQEQAEARLAQTIKSTGGAAGLSADQLKRMATELQGVTKFGDEAIIGAESLLLTFKDIGEDTFPRALESILDVSEAMGQDLQSSTVQIGKALNDPIGGISALTRVGIQFTEEQKEMIKVMTEAGDVAGAQAVILGELESQFGGVAKAAADTATGQFVQFQNAMGDVKEALGGVLANAFAPLAEKLTVIAGAITDTVNNSQDLKEAFSALESGTATSEQKLMALTNQLVRTKDAQAAAASINQAYASSYDKTIKQLETDIALEQQRLASSALDAKYARESAEANNELASSQETGRKELEDYINLVNTEYSKTQQYKVEALQEEIAMWEEYEETAKATHPEVMAILEEKRAQLAELMGEERDYLQERLDAITIEAEAMEGMAEAEKAFTLLVEEEEQKKQEAFEKSALAAIDYAGTLGFAFGQAIASGESFADATKELMKDVTITILKALAQEAAARSVLAFAALNIPQGVAFAGASVAAMTGAGAVAAFATGGDFVTNGPQLMMVGDNPGGRERVTVTPQGSANLNGGGGTNRLVLEILPRGLVKPMQTVIDNQEIIIR